MKTLETSIFNNGAIGIVLCLSLLWLIYPYFLKMRKSCMDGEWYIFSLDLPNWILLQDITVTRKNPVQLLQASL